MTSPESKAERDAQDRAALVRALQAKPGERFRASDLRAPTVSARRPKGVPKGSARSLLEDVPGVTTSGTGNEPLFAWTGAAHTITITCYVELQRKRYVNGLEAIELFVAHDCLNRVPHPPPGSRQTIQLRIVNSAYTAGLRTHPSTGAVYVCPDLLTIPGGSRTSLAKAFDENGLNGVGSVDVAIEGDQWVVTI